MPLHLSTENTSAKIASEQITVPTLRIILLILFFILASPLNMIINNITEFENIVEQLDKW